MKRKSSETDNNRSIPTSDDSLENKDSKNSNQTNDDEEFPGYPHYPAKEDVMNKGERVVVDVENFSRSTGITNNNMNISAPVASMPPTAEELEDEIEIVPGTEADVTQDDLFILDATDGAVRPDSLLTTPSEITEEELDIPGAELDDSNEDIGEEDEENNHYSLGGDRHDNLEEDPLE